MDDNDALGQNEGSSKVSRSGADLQEAKEIALQRCNEAIEWYSEAIDRNRRLYRWSTTLAVLLGGLTPVLVVFQALYQDYQSAFMILAALFPAVAAIITGLNGLYQWKDNYTRVAHVTQMLKSEKVKFLTRSSPRYKPELSDQEIVNNLVTRIESICLKEVSDWRTQFDEGMDLNAAMQLVLETRSSLATTTALPTDSIKQPKP
jgi:hypothetical protein